MKKWIVGIVLQVSLSSLALASSVEKPRRCTRDINPWGWPSHCTCAPGYSYKPMIGTCVKPAGWHPKPARQEGIFRTDLVSAGGETTGFGVEVDGKITELVLKTADKSRLKDSDSRTVRLVGQQVVLPSVEPHGETGWVAILVDEIELVN